jgi:hypothetical protein
MICWVTWRAISGRPCRAPLHGGDAAADQGLTLVHLELNLAHSGHIHGSIWVTWGTKTAQVELRVNECKPLPPTRVVPARSAAVASAASATAVAVTAEAVVATGYPPDPSDPS